MYCIVSDGATGEKPGEEPYTLQSSASMVILSHRGETKNGTIRETDIYLSKLLLFL